jgi:hypothetical protein
MKIFGIFKIFCGFRTQFLNMISRVTTFCSTKVLSQEESKFADRVLHGTKKIKNNLKQYNLAIYVVNFFEKNFTHYHNSLRQDLTIESSKKIKFFLYAICTKSFNFRVFFCKIYTRNFRS